MMDKKTNKIEFIDWSKGIAIFLVVLGHALKCLPEPMNHVVKRIISLIYLVHMPLFFIIAGMLFSLNEKKYKAIGFEPLLRKKSRLYLVPYVSFSILLYIMVEVGGQIQSLQSIINRIADPMSLQEFIFSLVTYQNHMDGHLWFSYVMFVVLMVALLLINIQDKYILIELYILYVFTFYFTLPEVVWKSMRYLFLFYIGKLIYRTWYKLKKAKLIYYISAFVVTDGIYLILRATGNPVMGFVKPFAEVTSSCIILIILSRLKNNRMTDFFDRLGKESYAIYLFHQPYIVPPIMALLGKNGYMYIVAIVISTVLGIVVPIVINDRIIAKRKLLRFLCLGES